MILRALIDSGHVDGTCLTVTGETLAEVYGGAAAPDGAVVRAAGRADLAGWRARGAQGQSVPGRRAAQARRPRDPDASRVLRGCSSAKRIAPARSKRAPISAGEVLIIRNEGPVGGPGMQEMLGVTALIYGQQMGEKVALVTDGRFSGATRGHLRRLCRAGGGDRRAVGAGPRRRPRPHRCRAPTHGSADRRARTGGTPRRLAAAPAAPQGRTAGEIRPARSVRPTRAPSPTRAAPNGPGSTAEVTRQTLTICAPSSVPVRQPSAPPGDRSQDQEPKSWKDAISARCSRLLPAFGEGVYRFDCPMLDHPPSP